MKARALLFLRITFGGLLIWWGLDKFYQVEHGVQVAQHFYWGVGTGVTWLRLAGIVEILLGALVLLGLWRRWAYPALALLTGITLLAVWRSVLDPWGWWLTGANVLFYPSVIIWAASLVLWAFSDEDRLALDRRRDANRRV
ncbi:MAG: DoxX family membrane protein [Gemmatimonadales bacterium]|nr:DoxX family membrane protein [Gemmatimonadales bacterium]